jgi:anti-sigma factor RsiW
VTACRDFDLLLSLHATGALDAAEAARVEAHLAACAACRAEVAADREALSAATLPPVSEAERRAVASVPGRALAALHRGERRRSGWKRVAAAVAVAAAAFLAILAPALLRRTPEVPVPAGATAAATATWQVPDLDTVWEDTAIVDLEDAAASSSGSDAALAALDY